MVEIDIEDALRLAINLLRDSAESKSMPSGLPLDEAAIAVNNAAADVLATVLTDLSRPT